MELTMAAQEDATPWDLSLTGSSTSLVDLSPCTAQGLPNSNEPILHGRSYISALGLVRRKPSRPDAPPTLSKSCSDKLALKQSTSLLSSITSLLISPQNCYIHSLVLPLSQYSDVACKRAFSSSGRLAPLARKDGQWEGGYSFRPFQVLKTAREFSHSRRQNLSSGEKIIPSNIASFSTPRPVLAETLIGGTLQGRKQFSLQGASSTSKRSIWGFALEIATLMSLPVIKRCLEAETYSSLKNNQLLVGRRNVKEVVRKVLVGWAKNLGGEDFSIHK